MWHIHSLFLVILRLLWSSPRGEKKSLSWCKDNSAKNHIAHTSGLQWPTKSVMRWNSLNGRDLINVPSHSLGLEIEMTLTKNSKRSLGGQITWLVGHCLEWTRFEEQERKRKHLRAGNTAECLNLPIALAESPSFIPSVHVGWFTTICKSSSKVSDNSCHKPVL